MIMIMERELSMMTRNWIRMCGWTQRPCLGSLARWRNGCRRIDPDHAADYARNADTLTKSWTS